MLNPILSNWEFALFSANVHSFFPALSWEEHDHLYDKWRIYHKPTKRSVELDDVHKEALKTLAPGILTLFHLGNHLESPVALADSGLVFDIVLDQEVYRKSQNLLNEMLQKLNILGKGDYRFLFSNDAHLLLKCRSSFKKGKHILIFADGSSGTGAGGKNQRIKIPFFASYLNCKQGIPALAFLFKVQIYPLLTSDKNTNVSKLQLQTIISPNENQKKEDFTRIALTKLYKMLETAIQKDPWRWECWSYLHSNGMLNSAIESQTKQVHQGPYIFVNTRNGYYLFDRRYYSAQKINFVQNS